MPKLNDADALYLGTAEVSRAYLGSALVWGGDPVPSNLSPPTVSVGTWSAGAADLTMTSEGTWTGSPTSYAYQWQTDPGAGWEDVVGETGTTYEDAPDGDYRLRVIATNAAGDSDPAYSAPVTVEEPTARLGNENPAFADTTLPGSDGRAFMTRFELTEAGTLDHVAIYSVSTGAGLVKGLVYADSAGEPGAMVAVGTAVPVVENGWCVSVCADQALTPGFYWIGAITEDFLSNMRANASTGTGWAQFGDSNFASPPNPWSGGSSSAYDVIAYIEYTPT